MPQQQTENKIQEKSFKELVIAFLYTQLHKFILGIIQFFKETKWIFFAFFLFGAFHTVIESFLNTILVNPILSKFEDNMMARYGIIGLSLLIAVANTKKTIKNKKHISFKHLTCVILPTLIYVYYRGYENLCSFIPLEHTYNFQKIGNSSIAYLDIIIGSIIIPSLLVKLITHIPSFIIKYIKSIIEKLISYIKQCTHKIIEFIKQYIEDTTKETLLYSDNPITELEDDTLGRKTLAESIAQLLKDKIGNDNTSFTFAITSKWGNGKTSFINLILKQLDIINKNKYEPFEFQAWKISSSDDITSIFFKELAKKIKPYHSNLTDDIVNYGQTLTNNSNSSAISLIHNICSLSSNKTIEEKFNAINKQLEKINKKFIIIIDDLDRLDGNEIFALLKIIRNSAYFNNLLFISAFDEDYVIKALDKINLPKPEQYIEKIFQSKYALIAPNKQTITNLLRDKILSIIQKESNIIQDITDINQFDFNSLNEIKNIRDVNLFLNIFALSYHTLKSYVYIIDLLYISLLKYKYQIIYFYFIDNFNKFIIKEENYISLFKKDKNYPEKILMNLSNSKQDLEISLKNEFKKDYYRVYQIIKNIFKQKPKNKLSFIQCLEPIKTYCSDNPSLKTHKNNNNTDLIFDIQNSTSIERYKKIRKIPSQINTDSTYEDIKKIIYTIFEICTTATIYFQAFETLIIVIKKKEDDAKTIIGEIINNNEYSDITSYFLCYLSSTEDTNILYTKSEKIKIIYNFFNIEFINENLNKMYLYYFASKSIDNNDNTITTMETNFKTLIIKNPDNILPTFIMGTKNTEGTTLYSINPFLQKLWTNYDSFNKEFSNSKSFIVKEFTEFYLKWKYETNHKRAYGQKYIALPKDFNFTNIIVPAENIF